MHEPQHDRAAEIFTTRPRSVSHSYILAEFVALANSRGTNRGQTLDFISGLLQDSNVKIVWIDETQVRRGLEMLMARQDKSWSLCDAVSFVLMDDEGITEGLTTDHHFEQAGFVRLLTS